MKGGKCICPRQKENNGRNINVKERFFRDDAVKIIADHKPCAVGIGCHNQAALGGKTAEELKKQYDFEAQYANIKNYYFNNI